jgi:hypothetical protein
MIDLQAGYGFLQMFAKKSASCSDQSEPRNVLAEIKTETKQKRRSIKLQHSGSLSFWALGPLAVESV